MSTIRDTSQHYTGWNSESIIVLVTASVSLYNAIELLLMILLRFNQWRSLLFTSVLVASFGIIPYFIGFMCEYFRWAAFWITMTVSSFGWVMLITGQSVVLYSRLGLILANDKILKGVKWMIIVDAIIFHTATTVIQYGTAYGRRQEEFTRALFYMEKIQMTGFCIQEFIISGLYLWKTAALLKVIQKEGIRKAMIELFVINIIIVLGDIALLVLEYGGWRVMERTWKGLVYSIKLKLEFAVLSKLVNIAKARQTQVEGILSDVGEFVDLSRTNTGATATATATATAAANDLTSLRPVMTRDKFSIEYVLDVEEGKSNVMHLEDIRHTRSSSQPVNRC